MTVCIISRMVCVLQVLEISVLLIEINLLAINKIEMHFFIMQGKWKSMA